MGGSYNGTMLNSPAARPPVDPYEHPAINDDSRNSSLPKRTKNSCTILTAQAKVNPTQADIPRKVKPKGFGGCLSG